MEKQKTIKLIVARIPEFHLHLSSLLRVREHFALPYKIT